MHAPAATTMDYAGLAAAAGDERPRRRARTGAVPRHAEGDRGRLPATRFTTQGPAPCRPLACARNVDQCHGARVWLRATSDQHDALRGIHETGIPSGTLRERDVHAGT